MVLFYNGVIIEQGETNNVHQTFNTSVADTNFNNYIQIKNIGLSLYTYRSVWVLLTSLILLQALV